MADTQDIPVVETPDIGIPLGAPVWMDLVTDDTAAAAEFYRTVFGWVAHDTPEAFGGYKYFALEDGRAVGGCMVNDPQFGMPNVFSIFLKTRDSRKTEELAKANGGEVLMETMDVGANGSFTVIKDPGGAVISAWQAGTEKGFGVINEVNSPTHFELHTRDHAKTVDFYSNVFGWNPHHAPGAPDFVYTMYGTPEEPRAGIMDATAFLPEEIPAHWSVYIKVTDADQTVAKAQRAGGTLIMGIDDTPFGRLATMSDPTGAVFKIQQL